MIVVDQVEEEVSNIVMADDGSAGNIFIPSFLIGKKDGDLIKEVLEDEKKKKQVAFKLYFSMPHPDNSVEFEI